MFLFSFLFIWFLFVLLFSFLCQLSFSFFIPCFRWNHCFLVFFFCFYLVLSCWSYFHLSSISAVTCWLLVFCIFIYSCNYILMFSSISSSFLLLLRCLMSWSPAGFSYMLLSSAYNIFVLFVVMIFLAAVLRFLLLFFLFLALCKYLRNYFFMYLLNNINI